MKDESSEQLISTRNLVRLTRTNLYDAARAGRALVEQRMQAEASCARGCAYCCYPKVIVDLGQGALIATYLAQEGRWTPKLEATLAEADREMTARDHDGWHALRRPCVFLKEASYGHGTCSIYPIRPYACAMTFAIGDPKDCGIPGGRSILQVVMDRANTFFGSIYRSFMVALGHTGDVPLATLPGAVLVAGTILSGRPPPRVAMIDRESVHDDIAIEDAFDQATVPRGKGDAR